MTPLSVDHQPVTDDWFDALTRGIGNRNPAERSGGLFRARLEICLRGRNHANFEWMEVRQSPHVQLPQPLKGSIEISLDAN